MVIFGTYLCIHRHQKVMLNFISDFSLFLLRIFSCLFTSLPISLQVVRFIENMLQSKIPHSFLIEVTSPDSEMHLFVSYVSHLCVVSIIKPIPFLIARTKNTSIHLISIVRFHLVFRCIALCFLHSWWKQILVSHVKAFTMPDNVMICLPFFCALQI